MVQFLSINFFSWISSIFVGFFKSSRFLCHSVQKHKFKVYKPNLPMKRLHYFFTKIVLLVILSFIKPMFVAKKKIRLGTYHKLQKVETFQNQIFQRSFFIRL